MMRIIPSKSITSGILCILAVLLLLAACTSSTANAIRYFPQRTSAEAAVVEWGHSAIISALDGAVATFGPQTSQGANFEVETSPVLANPIDGVGSKNISDLKMLELPKLDNADDVLGNMVIMTDSAGLSGVAMARIAKESGAAALMIVNTDQDAGDYIFSLEAETEEEAQYAQEHIDIPVIMVSLQAGNVITTALLTDDMDAETVNKGGALPDRVRLYAGGDRPFFEDAISNGPVVYMIHNMLTGEECDELIQRAEGRYDLVGSDEGRKNNYLENTLLQSLEGESTTKAADATQNIERVTLWKGGVAGKFYKDIDERKLSSILFHSSKPPSAIRVLICNACVICCHFIYDTQEFHK
jgi:hypothetical protein